MQRCPHSLNALLGCILALFLLNSCYFNSAGHLFDKAGHRSVIDTADLSYGEEVYERGFSYYVELPRYRLGEPVTTQYSALDQREKKSDPNARQKTDDTIMVEIPQDYAMYLIGKSEGPVEPSYMTRSKDDPVSIKVRCSRHTITRSPLSSRQEFDYTSPAAAGWYALGVLDWLCIDLPITCVENTLALSYLALVKLVEQAQEERRKQEIEFQMRRKAAAEYDKRMREKGYDPTNYYDRLQYERDYYQY